MASTLTDTRPPAEATRRGGKSVPELVSELWQLTVAYLKQETVVPIKGLGRYIAFGVAGSVMLAIGLVYLVLALLRGLQDAIDPTERLRWLPYLITLVVAAAVAGLAARAISAKRSR